jgi:transcription antitermination factor NusG
VTWALATTHPQIESRVAGRLEGAGFRVGLFWVKGMVVVRGILRDHFRPAFPRYLFVWVEGARWRELHEIDGVTGFVADAHGYPAVVGDMVVDDLTRRSMPVEGRMVLAVPPRVSRFRFGDSVTVVGNSLISGRRGIFQTVVGETHATLLIEVMGRFIPFRVPESELVGVPMRVPRKKHRHRWKKPGREGLVRTSTLMSPAAC